MNTRYGLKEVANVIFFDIVTNKPAIFFDTLKVSTIANDSQSAEATGGQGNNKLMSWDYGRTATLTIQDALFSDVSLSILAGTQVNSANVSVVGRESLVVSGLKVTLAQTPVANSITVYNVSGGIIQDEVTAFTVSAKDVTFTTGVTNGATVMVFYTYLMTTGATQITFSGNAFPATYRVVGDTVVRGQDGVDRKMQFVIPKAKLQSKMTLTMDAANVSTFDFDLDVLVDQDNNNKLYDIIRIG